MNATRNGHVTFGTSSVERVRIDKSGNVGIGTKAPSQKLDVAGVITNKATGSGYVEIWPTNSGDTHTGFLEFYQPTGGRTSYLGYGTASTMDWSNAGSLRLYGGKVGITESGGAQFEPSNTLDVTGTFRVSGASILGNTMSMGTAASWVSGATHTLYGDTASVGTKYIQWAYNNTPGTTIADAASLNLASPNVGINCNAPALPLDITGQTRIYEATGTGTVSGTANTMPTSGIATSTGSLTIRHGNAPGQSSIVFPSAINYGSDYGYITFMDDVSNRSAETCRLLIGCENDLGMSAGPDAVVLQPFGGYVGIGQMNPTYALDVNGNQQVKYNGSSNTGDQGYGTTYDTLTLRSTCNAYGGGIASIFFGNNQSNYPLARIYAQDAQPTGGAAYLSRLVFQTNNSNTTLVERMRIDANGYVGIQCNAPQYVLDVSGTARATTGVIGGNMVMRAWAGNGSYSSIGNINTIGTNNSYALMQHDAGETYVNSADGYALHLRTGNTERIWISSAGVGINTTGPASGMHIQGKASDITGGLGALLVDYPNANNQGPTLTLRNSAGGIGAYAAIAFELDGSTALNTSPIQTPINANQANGYIYCINSAGSGANPQAGTMGFQLWSGSQENEVVTIVGSNQRVGINTTSPSYQLDVNGDIRAQYILWASNVKATFGRTIGSATAAVSPLAAYNGDINAGTNNLAQIEFQHYNGGGYTHYIGSRHEGGGNGGAYTGNAIDFYLYSNATGAAGSSSAPNSGNVRMMSVTAAGVGINTAGPEYKLDVNGTARVTGATILGGNLNMSNNNISNVSNIVGPNTGSQLYIKSSDGQRLIYIDGTNIGVNVPSGQFIVTAPITGNTSALGTTATNSNLKMSLYNNNGNNSYLRVIDYRESTGTDWFSAATRIQQRIDETDQAYLQFNGTSNAYGACLATQDVSNALVVKLDGKVGLGTWSPDYKLDVNGTAKISSTTAGTNYLILSNSTAGGSQTRIQFYGGGGGQIGGGIDLFPYSPSLGGKINFRDNGYGSTFEFSNGEGSANPTLIERFRIGTNGNIGINCNAPGYTLDVNGSARVSGIDSTFRVLDRNGLFQVTCAYGEYASLKMNGYLDVCTTGSSTVKFRVPSDDVPVWFSNAARNNFGIQTKTPATTLDVNGGLTVRNGIRPLYQQISSGTSITPAASSYGTHYDIITSAISSLLIGYPASGEANWSNDSNSYWVFRNNTGSYMNMAVTYTAAVPNVYPSSITIPPSSSVTLMAVYPGGATNSNYVLF